VVFLPQGQECTSVIEIGASLDTAPAWTKPITKRPAAPPKPQTPQQVIATAQQQARVQPDARGYFGGSAEYTYVWQPGKIFQVYVATTQATAISLPRGETLTAGLYLDPEAYEVKNTRIGNEGVVYDVIVIRPLKDQGELDTFLLGASGRKYLLHLSTGTTGMIAVTFETPALTDGAATLVLPKP
jgi:type IV secretion system protein VirB9